MHRYLKGLRLQQSQRLDLLSPDAFSAKETPNLLSAKIRYGCAIIHLWDVRYISRDKPIQQTNRTN